MSDQLKSYEKAGRLIRLFAWLSLIAIVGIAAAVFIPILTGGINTKDSSVSGGIVALAITSLLVYFQFALGTAIKEHKEWGRTVGIIYGILSLFGFPIGTIAGGYVLYCLFKGWNE